MYYYIFEPPVEAQEYERTARIKEYLASLGIAGEMVSPTSSRTVEDLVQLAVAKRYSTIVVVGGMHIINQVAHSLEEHDVVFGIIPLKEHPDITKLIGTSEWKVAADLLKRRLWMSVRLGLINNDYSFLTPASIVLKDDCWFQVTTTEFSFSGSGGILTIIPTYSQNPEDQQDFRLELEGEISQPSFWQKLFKPKNGPPIYSRFSLTSFEFQSERPLSVEVAGITLCSSPFTCRAQSKPVKLIVARTSSEE